MKRIRLLEFRRKQSIHTTHLHPKGCSKIRPIRVNELLMTYSSLRFANKLKGSFQNHFDQDRNSSYIYS